MDRYLKRLWETAHLLASLDQYLLIHSALCPAKSRCTIVPCSRQQAGKSIQSGTMRSASSFTRRMGFTLKSKRHVRSWPRTERQKRTLTRELQGRVSIHTKWLRQAGNSTRPVPTSRFPNRRRKQTTIRSQCNGRWRPTPRDKQVTGR